MTDFASSLRSFLNGWTWPLPHHPFGLLACLPGFIALFNLIAVKIRFDRTLRELRRVARKRPASVKEKRQPAPGFDPDVAEYGPRWSYMIFGVIALTTVFGIVAVLGGHDAWPTKVDLGAGRVTSGTPNGLEGLVYAGYGAYIYTLVLVISRLNSAALTGKFLAVSSVRSAIALMLGYVAAATNIFSGLSSNQSRFVLFFIGLFPSWAMDALRKKAQEIFKPAIPACDILPLCMIDGLDDGIADRLAETGLWDIVHIATCDPFGLAAKTLYPVRRIIDWMDQAILISYVRDQIVVFRTCGIRGAIDLAGLYSDAMGLSADVNKDKADTAVLANFALLRTRAQELIGILAQKTSLPEQVIYTIGRNVYEDAVVNYLWTLWFGLPEDGKGDDQQEGDVVPAKPEGS
jgi:hypothetical protein